MKIFWIQLSTQKYSEIFTDITAFNTQNIVFTPNPEILLKTKTDPEFKELLDKATYLTSDGIGLYIAYQINDSQHNAFIEGLLLPYYFFNLFFRRKYLYNKYWERICGSDLTGDLVSFAENNNVKVAIIDPYFPQDVAKCKAQETFREDLLKKFPKLDFDFFVYKPEEKDTIIEHIKNSDSKILFSTLWMKKQEQSVVEIMDKCYNVKLWLWIGSSFDYFTGFQKRAPKIWRNLWLEWLYRLVTWPQKIVRLKRLWAAIVVFLWEVLKNKKQKLDN